LALAGYVDICTNTLIAGWAWDNEDPGRRVVVEILADGKSLGHVMARQYRQDLKDNGIGDGAYGFSYSPPLPIDLVSQRISVAAAGTGVYLSNSQLIPPPVGGGRVPLNWPPIEVDLSTNADELQAMYDHVDLTWSQLGSVEPYWSVLTHPSFRTEVFARYKEEFFESGKSNLEDFLAFTQRSGIHLPRERTCFELGCGVGRLTAWLSTVFSRVIAADISAGHLEIAETVLAERGVRNVSLLHLGKLDDVEKVGSFDVFFSVIVLQHNPPPIMSYMLRTLLRQLNPGGMGYFQIPTYSKGYTFRVKDYLSAQIKSERHMEEHVLPQKNVIEIIYDCNCKLLEVREDAWTGDINGVSNTFLVQKCFTGS
jgi:2-polyprenyl-3-methyl-5-hydroxy-6-metoxy-1,4-benzoquinol methylase